MGRLVRRRVAEREAEKEGGYWSHVEYFLIEHPLSPLPSHVTR